MRGNNNHIVFLCNVLLKKDFCRGSSQATILKGSVEFRRRKKKTNVNGYKRQEGGFCLSPWQTAGKISFAGWCLGLPQCTTTKPSSCYLSNSWLLLLMLMLLFLFFIHLIVAWLVLPSTLTFIVTLLAQDVIYLFCNKEELMGNHFKRGCKDAMRTR